MTANRNGKTSIWDDPRADEILRGFLSKEGYPAIADRINSLGIDADPVSPSAVGGRAMRLGLRGRPGAGRPQSSPAPKAARRNPMRKSFNFAPQPIEAHLKALPLPEEHASDAPPNRRVPLLKLNPDGCRYFIGDTGTPDGGFCPDTQTNGSKYCLGHYLRCVQNPR